MATPDIVFYTSKACPFAHRMELAFQEAGADVTRYQIDLQNKPEWYALRVNPAGKVPTLVAESLVLLEFAADLYPDSGLLPRDPVERARVRFFIDAVNKLFAPFAAFFIRGEAPDDFIAAFAEVQELLQPTGFAVGDNCTIADATLAPFLGRWELQLRHDVGKFAEGTGPRVHAVLFQSERFSRLQTYLANIASRQSFKNSFDPEYLLERARVRYGRENQ